MSFEENLEKYADVLINVGLNVQPNQPVFIGSPSFGKGTNLEIKGFVRHLVQKAYEAGASLVSVLWEDDELTKIRIEHANPDTLDNFEKWKVDSMIQCIDDDGAVMRIYSNSPDTFGGYNSDIVSQLQGVSTEHMIPYREAIGRNRPSWLVSAAANEGWAQMVFPDLPMDEAVAKLWDVIFDVCRVTVEDPVKAWQEHQAQLAQRGDYLTDKGYTALHFKSEGTDLEVGLVEGYKFNGGGSKNGNNVPFVANIPTEEVFTTPHKDRVNGVVTATKPLSYGGTIIDGFSLTFEDGKVVDVKAEKGEKILKEMIARDEGACRLGEVALVPHSSPISASGILFCNTLFDENASCHIALGRAYRALKEPQISQEEFEELGGNTSMIHVDFMIGSADTDIDGILPDGTSEPVMRAGEWAFEV